MRQIHGLIWLVVFAIVAVAVVASAMSPLLAWRQPVYIVAGFAGVFAMVILLFQPLLIAGLLPGLPISRSRRIHRWVGIGLLLSVVTHVAGLWITSPPDMIDALLFASPTPFSVWGVVAMWAIFASGCMVVFRRKLLVGAQCWRWGHRALAVVIVIASVLHAMMIDGTMELISKFLLCMLVLVATIIAVFGFKSPF